MCVIPRPCEALTLWWCFSALNFMDGRVFLQVITRVIIALSIDINDRQNSYDRYILLTRKVVCKRMSCIHDCLHHVFMGLQKCNSRQEHHRRFQKKIQFHTARATETTVSRTARRTARATVATQTLSAVSNIRSTAPVNCSRA